MYDSTKKMSSGDRGQKDICFHNEVCDPFVNLINEEIQHLIIPEDNFLSKYGEKIKLI